MVKMIATMCAVALVTACSSNTSQQTSTDPAKAAEILQIVNGYMKEAHLKSVILKVSADGKDIVTAAAGQSMTGVPATVDMHFRDGAVAISYVSTLLMILVEEKKVSLGDLVSNYRALSAPDLGSFR